MYREDVRRKPGNGWSLDGLARGLETQGDHASATDVTQPYEKAWRRADVKLQGSRF